MASSEPTFSALLTSNGHGQLVISLDLFIHNLRRTEKFFADEFPKFMVQPF